MSLNDDYLIYPHRAYGMDQSRYPWRPRQHANPLSLPGGAKVAAVIVVPIEHHNLTPESKPFRPPGAMVTAYPDLRHYTTRDYGNRVGVFRLLTELRERGLAATFPMNAEALSRFTPLVEAIVEGGNEIAAYGARADKIHWSGMEAGIEASIVAEVRDAFSTAGLQPRAWMSPARQQSFATLDLIAEQGFDICLDWEQDTTPTAMATNSSPVTAIPISTELDDRNLMIERRQTEDDWADQIIEAVDYLKSEYDRFGAQMLGFTLTPYVSGQPFRIHALRRVLTHLANDDAVAVLTASDLVEGMRSAVA